MNSNTSYVTASVDINAFSADQTIPRHQIRASGCWGSLPHVLVSLRTLPEYLLESSSVYAATRMYVIVQHICNYDETKRYFVST